MGERRVDRLHDLFRRFGVDIGRFRPESHHLARRARLLDTYNVDLVVDVGAGDGDYGRELRRLGYRGRIVSFEPLPSAAAQLDRRREGDSRWEAFTVALGGRDEEGKIHVAGNSVSSSILEMLPIHEQSAPGSANIGVLPVSIRRLDGLAAVILAAANHPFLKLDAQGYEMRILEGARESLERFVGVQAELSVEPLYSGAPNAREMLSYLDSRGFVLMGIEPGFVEPQTGRLLQFDGVFFRPQSAVSP